MILHLTSPVLTAQNSQPILSVKKQPEPHIFNVSTPDFTQSPFTGMTRKHWKDAALYLLEGAFSYVNKVEDPMVFPKQPGKSYPREAYQLRTEKLEGFCRTLLLAAPLLREHPNLKIGNVGVGDYYRHQLRQLIDSTSEAYISPRPANGGTSQNLVEFGALSLCLFIIPEVLWQPLTRAEKDALASLMISYGDGPTVPSNWKFFNIFVLSFFKKQGYVVNENLLKDYLQKSLEHYRGDGWYNDNPAYDYYSMWAFQMYGTIWAEYFGKEYFPDIASKFLQNLAPIASHYPYFFGKNGDMIMWGRSISYRFGAVVPMSLLGFASHSGADYGWMRRISSGAILQFLQNPDFLKDRVPTLGFYGPFEPAVQSYSCRASVYWLSKAFLGLLIPDDHQFWSAKESNGAWDKSLLPDQAHNKFLPGPELLITNYAAIGASEIRAWCNVPIKDAGEPFRGSENYNRLAYNSAFPWQADGVNGEVAMNYLFSNKDQKWEAARLFTFKKYEDGVFYRDMQMESNPAIKFHLADIPLKNGILRIDISESTESVGIRMGHYALPEVKDKIKSSTKKINGQLATFINNSQYELAVVPLRGWNGAEVRQCEGLHPVSKNSSVINVFSTTTKKNEYKLFVTLMLWKNAGEAWTDDELLPVEEIREVNKKQQVEIKFKDGSVKIIKY